MVNSLYDSVRSGANLFAAWRHVKKSALASKNDSIRGQASEFEHSHQRYIRTIQTQLRERRFKFDAYEGVLKDKRKRESEGKKPRPIAIGSIRNRVVQRAILQVLQPRRVADPSNPNSPYIPKNDSRIGKLNAVNNSRYGIGGLMRPYGGVKPGIEAILDAMKNGATHFFQSDIRAFFTAIPTANVCDIIQNETNDDELVRLFKDALVVHLANKEELSGYADIFPQNGIGVAQGSSLSAFAGNVLLFDLDHELNEKGATAIRYIDDVFITSNDPEILAEAVDLLKCALDNFGLSLYDPKKDSSKAAAGKCRDGFTFLGCSMQPNRCVPSVASKRKLLEEVRKQLSLSKRSINAFVSDPQGFNPEQSKSFVLEKVGRKLYGWQKSFSFSTSAQVFAEVDEQVKNYVVDYNHAVHRAIRDQSSAVQMRVIGIPNLAEIHRQHSK